MPVCAKGYRYLSISCGLFVGIASVLVGGCSGNETVAEIKKPQPPAPNPNLYTLDREVLKVGNIEWRYDLYTPNQCKHKASPVVIALHGHGGDSSFAPEVGLINTAVSKGFILLAPNGQHAQWQDITGSPLQKDDLAFFQKILDLIPSLGGDPKRVYACGFSNGGGMSFFLGAYFSERIAAVMGGGASVGAINDNLVYCGLPNFKRPISCLMEHGMKDTSSGYGMETFTMSQQDALTWWAKQIGATKPPKHSELAKGEVLLDACEGKDGSEVLLYSYRESDHTWPGVYDSQYGLAWNDLMWNFFQKHPLP